MGSCGSNPKGGIMDQLTIICAIIDNRYSIEKAKVLITLPIWRWENSVADCSFQTSNGRDGEFLISNSRIYPGKSDTHTDSASSCGND